MNNIPRTRFDGDKRRHFLNKCGLPYPKLHTVSMMLKHRTCCFIDGALVTARIEQVIL